MSDLTNRQERFIIEYVREPVGSKAAIAAGYSSKGASRAAIRLLEDPRIKGEIDRRNTTLAEDAGITKQWLLDRLVKGYEDELRKDKPNSMALAKFLSLIGDHINVGAWKADENGEKAAAAAKSSLPPNIFQFLIGKVREEKEEKVIET